MDDLADIKTRMSLNQSILPRDTPGGVTPRKEDTAMSTATQLSLLEHLLDPAQRLPRPLLILNQREPHMPIPMLAESYAGANRDLGLQQQLLRELHRPQPAILLWNLCPGEHRSLRQFHRPSQP